MLDPNRYLCITKCLSGITQPVRTTKRVKYQCIETSSNYICAGASTGSIYVFERSNATLIKFISNKLNGIVMMKFSNKAKVLAVADCMGLLTFWEVDEQSHSFKVIKEIEDFNGCVITSLCWSDAPSRIFVGDSDGKVMSFSMGYSTFSKQNVEVIRKSGESVVQLEICNGKLLVSTKKKTVLYNEDRFNFIQIGTKSRDGIYGSCFLKDVASRTATIYSARPGSRLWEVDFDGQVLSTHQFKELLAVPPSPIVTSSEVSLPESNLAWSHPQAFNFPLLYPIMSRYLLTWSPRGIYLFEPRVGIVVAWNDQIIDVVGISTTGHSMYFLHSDCSITEVSLLTVRECLFALRKMEEWEKLLKFACSRQDEIFDNVESFIAIGFHDVLLKFKEIPDYSDDLVLKVEDFIYNLEQKHAEVRAEVEARLNQMWTITDAAPVESTIDDNDDISSNISGGSGGSSSRRSLSIMSEISLNSFWQKATNIVQSKVVTSFASGFMQRSLQDALEAEGVFVDAGRNIPVRRNSLVGEKEYHSVPNSPRLGTRELKRTPSTGLAGTEGTSMSLDVPSSPNKSLSYPTLSQADDKTAADEKEKIVSTGPVVGKINRRKKKVKVRDIGGPGGPSTCKLPIADAPKPDNKTPTPEKIDDVIANATSPVSSAMETSQSLQESVVGKPAQFEVVVEPPVMNNCTNCTHECDVLEVSTDSIISMEKEADIIQLSSPKICKLCISLPSDVSSLVNKLVDITAATRNGIRDPGVLYNPKAIKDLLQRWANQSAKIGKEFCKACFKNLPQSIQDNVSSSFLSGFEIECGKLFFTQLSSAFGEVSNVAMLCIETNIYPKLCLSLRNHEVSLLNLDTTLDDIYRNTVEEWKILNESSASEEEYVKLEIGTDTTNEDGHLDVMQVVLETANGEHCNNLDEDVQNEIATGHTCVDRSIADIEISKSPENGVDGRSRNFSMPYIEVAKSPEKGAGGRSRNLSESCLDRLSVSTILSKSDTTDIDTILDGPEIEVWELKENHLLCENFNVPEGTDCPLCFIDKCRACFVLRYFPVLNFTRMRSILLWNGGCRWRTWLACMVHLQDLHKAANVSDLIENSRISPSVAGTDKDIEILLGCMTRLYDSSSELVLECINNEWLKPWEITLLYQTEIIQNSCIDDFLQYAFTELSSSRMDPLFAINTLHSAIMFQPSRSHIFCACGSARPGSHTVVWKWQNIFLKLVANIEEHYIPNEKGMVDKFCHLFAKNGFWLGYIQILSIVRDINMIITLIYQLGDYSLLSDLVEQGVVVPTDDLWEALLEKICQDMEVKDGHTCEPLDGFVSSLTLKKLIEVVATYSGSRFALAMINKFRCRNILPPDLYLSLLMATELENKQDSLVSKLIEVASGKLWSDKKKILHPQFELIKVADLGGHEASPVTPATFKSNPYVMEECDTVWGRSINISTAECPVCTLPLCLKTMSSSTAGLIVFQCGHSFHKVCLPETACLVCFHDTFTSI